MFWQTICFDKEYVYTEEASWWTGASNLIIWIEKKPTTKQILVFYVCLYNLFIYPYYVIKFN